MAVVLLTAPGCDTRASQEKRVREVLERHRAEWQQCERLASEGLQAWRKAADFYIAEKYDEARSWQGEVETLKRQLEIVQGNYRSKVLADCRAHGVKDEALVQSVSEKWSQENRPAH